MQLTHQRLRFESSLDALREEFREMHTVRLPGLLVAGLLEIVLARLALGAWIDNDHVEGHEGIGREVILKDAVAFNLLHLVTNAPDFLGLIRDVTGCDEITRFEGRTYRMVPGKDHYDSWHSDAMGGRMVGMSLNLGVRPCVGGAFQLRESEGTKVLREIRNPVPGDAVLFRISQDLVHRVERLEGTEPRTAFAGWFVRGGVDYFSMVRAEEAPRGG
jgi:hypothetical protein